MDGAKDLEARLRALGGQLNLSDFGPLGSPQGHTSPDMNQVMAQLGVAQLQQYMPLVEAFVGLGKDEIRKVLALILGAGADVTEGLEPELERVAQLRAKAIGRAYKALQAEGFSKSQAYGILLAQIKPNGFGDALQSALKSVPQASSSRRK